MNPEQPEPCPSQASALQALSLSDIELGIGHNVERAQELQQELVQRRASLEKESVQAQALQEKEALLANIIKEEMAHQTQLSVLFQLHLHQAKEIKSQSQCLSTLMEKQQAIMERVQELQTKLQEMPIPQHTTSCLEELHIETFNVLPSTVNAR